MDISPLSLYIIGLHVLVDQGMTLGTTNVTKTFRLGGRWRLVGTDGVKRAGVVSEVSNPYTVPILLRV